MKYISLRNAQKSIGLTALGAALALSACSPKTAPDTTQPAPIVQALSMDEVLSSALRLEKDSQEDGLRKAAQVLAFTNLQAGNTVVELEAGSGYYTALFSKMVGDTGKIIMQNPAEFDAFIKPEIMAVRLAPLANVTLSKTKFDHIDAPDNSVDVVTWFLGPHEFFYELKDKDGNLADFGDAQAGYAEIFRVLKPGGRFIALDHVANTGVSETDGGVIHRIDPQWVTKRALHAGLTLTRSSDLFVNEADDHTGNVFAPNIRRKTDRFLHQYTKPE